MCSALSVCMGVWLEQFDQQYLILWGFLFHAVKRGIRTVKPVILIVIFQYSSVLVQKFSYDQS